MSFIGLNDLLHARLLAGQDGAPSPATVPDARCEVVPSLTDESCRPALVGEVRTNAIELARLRTMEHRLMEWFAAAEIDPRKTSGERCLSDAMTGYLLRVLGDPSAGVASEERHIARRQDGLGA